MSYVDKLVEKAVTGECPGCGPTLVELLPIPRVTPGSSVFYKYCTCCGWIIFIEYDPDHAISNLEFSSMPPDVDGNTRFECALQHPEHRQNWPVPERDEQQPDSFSLEELQQESLRLDGKHYYLVNPEQVCGLCGQWGSHKIAEERPNFYGHPYTSSLCCNCFETIFGPLSHRYEKVDTPVILGDS